MDYNTCKVDYDDPEYSYTLKHQHTDKNDKRVEVFWVNSECISLFAPKTTYDEKLKKITPFLLT